MKEKKNWIIRVVTALVCFCTSGVAFRLLGIRVLQYKECWSTFYYNSKIANEILSIEGLPYLVRTFFLQFFANPIHGAIVIASLLTCIMIALTITTKKVKNIWMKNALPLFFTFIIGTLIATSLSGMGLLQVFGFHVDPQNMQFMRLSVMTRHQDWDAIISETGDNTPISNLLIQNTLNTALAEKGILGDKIFDQPCEDIRSIYVDVIKTPEIAAMLSDIYYSMGHIAQAQRYAFEANEKMNNLSPRLLQRLVQTNIIYGQYDVAKKYLKWLDNAYYYHDWCEHYYTLLSDNTSNADPEISMKRKCLIEDNRFSGIRGLDDDLLHIARATKGTTQCRTTIHYLGSLYILAGYEQQFVSMIDEFKGTPDLPQPLPHYFEEYYKRAKTE